MKFAAIKPVNAPFTSVTSWRAYPAVTWDLVEYGAKDRSFRQFADLGRPRFGGCWRLDS